MSRLLLLGLLVLALAGCGGGETEREVRPKSERTASYSLGKEYAETLLYEYGLSGTRSNPCGEHRVGRFRDQFVREYVLVPRPNLYAELLKPGAEIDDDEFEDGCLDYLNDEEDRMPGLLNDEEDQ